MLTGASESTTGRPGDALKRVLRATVAMFPPQYRKAVNAQRLIQRRQKLPGAQPLTAQPPGTPAVIHRYVRRAASYAARSSGTSATRRQQPAARRSASAWVAMTGAAARAAQASAARMQRSAATPAVPRRSGEP